MIQTAKVLSILDDGRAMVTVKRQSACGHDCSKCGGGCAELAVLPTVTVKAENLAHAVVGDTVTVASSSKKILGAAVLVYMVPLVLFLLGYCVAGAMGLGGGVCAAIGIGGFVIGGLGAVLHDRHTRKKSTIHFSITAIEEPER